MADRRCESCEVIIGAGKIFRSTASSWPCKDGIICMDCYRSALRYPGDLRSLTGKKIKWIVKEAKNIDADLKEISWQDHIGIQFEYVAMFKGKSVFLPKRLAPHIEQQDFWRFSKSDIVSAELLHNNKPVKVNGMGRVVVGGLLFGAVGAAVGYASAENAKSKGVTESVKVIVNLRNYPLKTRTIELCNNVAISNSQTITASLNYGAELVNRLNDISGYTKPSDGNGFAQSRGISGASEIREYKALMDEGIITREEFEAKKAQILGLW